MGGRGEGRYTRIWEKNEGKEKRWVREKRMTKGNGDEKKYNKGKEQEERSAGEMKGHRERERVQVDIKREG